MTLMPKHEVVEVDVVITILIDLIVVRPFLHPHQVENPLANTPSIPDLRQGTGRSILPMPFSGQRGEALVTYSSSMRHGQQ
jgi:hypothetical protein